MKKIKLRTWMLLVSCAIVACNTTEKTSDKHANAVDTLAYTYHTIKERAADCGDKPDSSCTVASFTYPEFTTSSKKLEENIQRKLGEFFGTDTGLHTLAEQAKKFVGDYNEFKNSDTRTNMFWTSEAKASVFKQDSSLLSIHFQGYSYAGGAHGSSGSYYLNWDVQKDEAIRLSDLLTDNYQDSLRAIGEKIFRSQEGLSATASLGDGYFFENDKFSLNNNFVIKHDGLMFTYNQYEIKPYAAGITELTIPYDQIKSLIKPQSIIQQFIHSHAGL